MNTITKDAVIFLLMKCFPDKKKEDFIITQGIYTKWIYVKIDGGSRMGPNELYEKTGLDLRGLNLCNNENDNIKLWEDLILK